MPSIRQRFHLFPCFPLFRFPEPLLYAIGGRLNHNFGLNLDFNEEYDPTTDTWSMKAPLPTTRSGIAAAVLDGHIYVFGGEGQRGTFDETESYNPATDSWEQLAPMPTARHGLGAATIGRTIYVVAGGISPGPATVRRPRRLRRSRC